MSSTNSSSPTLEGMVDLLGLINRQPPPEVIVRNIAQGYLSPLGAERVSLHVASRCGRFMRMVGAHGYPTGTTDRFTSIDTSVRLPVTDALRSPLTLVMAPAALPSLYPSLRASSETADTADLGGPGTEWTFVPILLSGTPRAVLACLVKAGGTTNRTNLVAIDGLKHALALWLERAWASAPATLEDDSPEGAFPLVFSPRQITILQLIAQGRSNPEIAHQLAISASTVKQEIKRSMIALDAKDRNDAAQRAQEVGLLDESDGT